MNLHHLSASPDGRQWIEFCHAMWPEYAFRLNAEGIVEFINRHSLTLTPPSNIGWNPYQQEDLDEYIDAYDTWVATGVAPR